MTIPIQSIIHFSQVDQRLRDLHKELTIKNNQLQKINSAILQLQQDVEAARGNISKKKKEIHALELSVKSFQEDIKKKKKRLESITLPREFAALEQEVLSIQQKIDTQEDETLVMLEQLDSDEKSFILNEQSAAILIREYSDKKNIIEEEKQSLVTQELHMQEERQRLFDRLPLDLKNQYERMKSRLDNPFVPAIGDSCGGCFMKLTSQDLATLRQSMVVLCKECYRLVYPQ